ncbi:MAG: hypothetical protein ABI873_09750 [Marmoricola sp.]
MVKWWTSGRTRLAVTVVVGLALVLVGGFTVIRKLDRSPLDRALDLVPAGSLRVAFTDWMQVRARLKPKGLVSSVEIGAFMSKGYDTDLTAASSIDESAAALKAKYGFSPVNADWEAYAQSRQGAVMVLQLPSDTDMAAIENNLDGLGYKRPTSGTGVWDGGVDLVAGIDPTITPELQYVVVDADKHLVLSSDTHAYAAAAAQVVTGNAPSLGGSSVAHLADRVPDPASAFLWAGDFACEDLSMSQAANDDRALADRLVARAGGIDPLSGLVMSMQPNRTLDVAMAFETSRQATNNLRPRAQLLVGDAVGRSGSLSDDLRLTRSRTEGSDVVLTLQPRAKQGFVLSQINSGPVLFATC